ncbi:hypothetical protein HMPREF1624_07123 [Sporothrix schenckii ATCC 58251]|uniref:Uncharacterized protein n=1 Tax=Sporothrix schenckii (strain ATCC 58251 / de Perez 2211183) TaxID=1391915 RepID=U7PN87_SPOS1|nr:hypothetical protein HMPREF1624_07123 [Sporothrix schenckii ATCC 58251]
MSTNTPIDFANIARPTRSVQPNCLTYNDDHGVQHRIYLPQGSSERASQLLMEKNWDELAKYEPYTNQGYKESDYKTIEETQ